MKRYRLKKDLPTFKAGDEFDISSNGNLVKRGKHLSDCIVAYSAQTLEKFPNILEEWFEEIPEKPKTVWDLEEDDPYFYISCDGDVKRTRWEELGFDYGARKYGNCFVSLSDAEKELARSKAKQILLRDTKGFKPKFGKHRCPNDYGWEVEFDVYVQKLVAINYRHQGAGIRFATLEDAEESIKRHPNEWKTYLGVEE